jgi:hypothetical protein
MTPNPAGEDTRLRSAARAFVEHVQAHACDHDASGAGTHTSCPPVIELDAALARQDTETSDESPATHVEPATEDERIVQAARDVDALWEGRAGRLIRWAPEAAEALEDLRIALRGGHK